MNFEEMLNSHEGSAGRHERLLYGVLTKRLIDRKYRNIIVLADELAQSHWLSEGLKADQQKTQTLNHRQQLHFELHDEGNGIREVELEQGNIQTFASLIDENPAAIAAPGFIDGVVNGLLDALDYLHEHHLYYLCLAPQNVFVRKNDSSPLLLFHASVLGARKQLAGLFAGCEDFVAPEVLEGEQPTEGSDVYAVGKFIEWLFRHGDMPLDYKYAVAKATKKEPSGRYASVADLRQALKKHRSIRRSAISFVAALAVVMVCVVAYLELTPKTENIEFVEAAPKEPMEDLLDDGFDPTTELGTWGTDSLDTLSEAGLESNAEYMEKAEQIFRKQFSKEADRILSKVYNKERMNTSEKAFIASSNLMRDELIKAQSSLATQAGLPEDRAGKIASEVLDALTAEKQKSLPKYGYNKVETGE
jgi:serine/threonine protein kinase